MQHDAIYITISSCYCCTFIVTLLCTMTSWSRDPERTIYFSASCQSIEESGDQTSSRMGSRIPTSKWLVAAE